MMPAILTSTIIEIEIASCGIPMEIEVEYAYTPGEPEVWSMNPEHYECGSDPEIEIISACGTASGLSVLDVLDRETTTRYRCFGTVIETQNLRAYVLEELGDLDPPSHQDDRDHDDRDSAFDGVFAGGDDLDWLEAA